MVHESATGFLIYIFPKTPTGGGILWSSTISSSRGRSKSDSSLFLWYFLNIDLPASGSYWALSYSGQQNLEIGRRNIRGSSHQMDLIVCLPPDSLLQVATTIMSRGQGSLRNPKSHDEVVIPIFSLPGTFPIGHTRRGRATGLMRWRDYLQLLSWFWSSYLIVISKKSLPLLPFV